MAIIWKGGWTSDGNGLSDTTYYEDEVVSHLNVSYIAKAEVAIGSPVPSSDMGNWDTFVSGAMGTSGTSGNTGPQGLAGADGTHGTSGTSGNNGQTLSPKGVEEDYASMIANNPTPTDLDTY
jgi:hypothetical protein